MSWEGLNRVRCLAVGFGGLALAGCHQPPVRLRRPPPQRGIAAAGSFSLRQAHAADGFGRDAPPLLARAWLLFPSVERCPVRGGVVAVEFGFWHDLRQPPSGF